MTMRFAVVGSDTEVGKTFVGCRVLEALVAAGYDAVGLKPVESGVGPDGPADALALGAAGGTYLEPRWTFEDPISPHLAARREGRRVLVEEAAAWVEEHARGVTLVETAGGLMSPLGEDERNLDLVVAVRPDWVVLVVPNVLGALHHALACRTLLSGRGVERVVVVLNGVRPSPVAASNREELGRLDAGAVVVTEEQVGAWAVATTERRRG